MDKQAFLEIVRRVLLIGNGPRSLVEAYAQIENEVNALPHSAPGGVGDEHLDFTIAPQ